MTIAQIYRATINHHSISQARTISVVGSLLKAKRAATAEFGEDYSFYKIVITNDNSEIVASRLIANKSWTNFLYMDKCFIIR